MKMEYREILFEVWERSGKKYRIYANGTTEGFPDDSLVINRYCLVRDALLSRYASEKGIEFDPEWAMKSSKYKMDTAERISGGSWDGNRFVGCLRGSIAEFPPLRWSANVVVEAAVDSANARDLVGDLDREK